MTGAYTFRYKIKRSAGKHGGTRLVDDFLTVEAHSLTDAMRSLPPGALCLRVVRRPRLKMTP